MALSIFFNYTLNNKKFDNDIFYNEEFVDFLVTNYLMTKKDYTANISEIKDHLLNFYKIDKININSYSFTPCENIFKKKSYTLKKRYINLYKVIKNNIQKIRDFNDDNVYQYIIEEGSHYNFNIQYLLTLILSLFYNQSNELFIEFILFKTYLHLHQYLISIDYHLSSLASEYSGILVDKMTDNQIIKKLLSSFEIKQLGDLKKYSPLLILSIFSYELDSFSDKLSHMIPLDLESFTKKIDEAYSVLKPNEEVMILEKYTLKEPKKKTLDKIGKDYGITRERVRQIIKNGINKLKKQFAKNIYIYEACYQLIKKDKTYFLIDELREYFIDESYLKKYLILILSSESNLVFDINYLILYDKNEININAIIKEIEKKTGFTIPEEDTINLNLSYKQVIKYHYRLNNNIYIVENCLTSSLYKFILDTYFKEGYLVSSEKDFTFFKEKLENDFHFNTSKLNMHSVQASIERFSDYVQIDRGKYRNIKYGPSLDDNLKEAIFTYINSNPPIVFYRTIYQNFETKLKALGINNSFYLKGLIDRELPDNLHSKRDYLQIDGKETSYNYLIDFLHSFPYIIHYQDLVDKFPGVKLYTFNTIIYKEMNNGLIWLKNKDLIYLKNTSLDREDKKRLFNIITLLMDELDGITVNSKSIYNELLNTTDPILKKLPFITSSFDLFSLIVAIFSDTFFFRRPFIYKNKIESSVQGINNLYRYLETLDSFDINIVMDYMQKLNIKNLNSYLALMDSFATNFVQIDSDTMVKKEKFKVEDINKFSQILENYFKTHDRINTMNFKDYAEFEVLNFNWNKYLLVGLIRTFCSDEYSIIETNKKYNLTDFIIKKK